MARYIDIDEFAERLLKSWDTADEEKRMEIVAIMANIITPILKDTPTADVKEVVRGEWMIDSPYSCSVCDGVNERKDNFCPHCGADMRGKRYDGEN